MSGVGAKDSQLKTAIEQLDLVMGRSDPNAFLNFQNIIFNTGRDSEEELTEALNGLNLTGEGELSGLFAIPRIRNAILLSGDEDAVRIAFDELLADLTSPAQFTAVRISHKSY